ncbi:MAG: ACP S-malonyltransferase [Desulfatiglandales bacterium]
MSNLAFMFPGQGSQYVGMGKGIMERFSSAREVFQMAEEICGIPVRKYCLEGPMEELTKTVHLQPCITAMNLAILKVLMEMGHKPMVCLGHSLGEYSALACSGVLSFEDTLKAVKERGELMEREAQKRPGTMAAVLGMDEASLVGILREVPDTVCIANYNSPEQMVISGTLDGVSLATKLVKEKGGKAVPLKVSGAWHSPLMEGALRDFEDFLKGLDFAPPEVEVVFNVTAQRERDPQGIRSLMVSQLISPVRWTQSVEACVSAGVKGFVEIGPKNVLSNLVKRILPKGSEIAIYNLEDEKGLEDFSQKAF